MCQKIVSKAEDRFVEKNEKGEWSLTETGEAEMKRRAMTGEEN